MATRIVLVTQGPNEEGGHQEIVQENFDQVLQQVFPLSAPSSALEEQANRIYTDLEGNRVYIHQQYIGWFNEDYEEEEE